MINDKDTINKFNKTKIIATIGPASQSTDVLTNLIKSGVSIIRLNSSHGTHEEHQKVIDTVRSINNASGTHVCLLQDLQGPKIRIGEVENGLVNLVAGQAFVITQEKIVGTATKISTTYAYLAHDVKIGDKILIDDGKIVLEVKRKAGSDVVTEVIHGGSLKSKKGINLPYTKISIPSITEKDKHDLLWGLQNEVEWVALSFVRAAKEVVDLKNMIKEQGKTARVIAKIEKPEAWENIDAIIEVADALMIARGDLGVEIAMESVPMVQKSIVAKCNQAGKPVIIATQMMESMIENPNPTRAETNDIANAVIDGADALMLSGETAMGKYPVEVIKQMKKTILRVEESTVIYNKYYKVIPNSLTFYNNSLVQTACRLSQEVNAKAIIGMTRSGYTAFELAKNRPKADIFIFTDNKPLLNTINLIWGIRGYHYDKMDSTDRTFVDVEKILIKKKHLKKGDIFISTASMPIKEKQKTNMLKINAVTSF